MSRAAPPRSSAAAEVVADRLATILFALRLASRAERAGRALRPLPLALLAFALLDAVTPLPAAIRAALAGAWLIGALLVLIALLLPARAARRAGALRAARLMEERLGIAGNAVVNAVQLRALAASGGTSALQDHPTLTGALAARAVERGAAAVRAADSGAVVDPRPALRAWAGAIAAAALLGLSIIAAPRVFSAAAPRFTDPFGAHPPWSPTEFSFTIAPAEPLAGDTVRIDVTLQGKLPASLSLVIVESARQPLREIDRVTMTPIAPDAPSSDSQLVNTARCSTLLRDVREPLHFYAEGATGRSRIVELRPIMKPRPTHASLTITPPEYARRAAATHAISVSGDSSDAAAGPGFTALVGSKVELAVGATLPIERAESSGLGDVEIAGHAASQSLALEAPGEFQLSLRPVAAAGLPMDSAVAVTIHALADAPPEITIELPAQPGERVQITPSAPINLHAAASDDVAVAWFEARWRLHRRASTDEPAHGAAAPDESGVISLIPDGADFNRIITSRTRLETISWNAAPGDSISLTLAAADNRPAEFGGAQSAESVPIIIEFVAPPELSPPESAGADTGAASPDGAAAAGEQAEPASAPPTRGDGAEPAEPGGVEAGATAAASPTDSDAAGSEQPGASGDGPESGELIDAEGNPLSGPEVGGAGVHRATDRFDPGAAAPDIGPIDFGGAGLAHVPAAYRELAGRYLQRIARDQRRPATPPPAPTGEQ